MISQIGSLTLSLAGILSLFNFFLFVIYKRSNDQRYLLVIERSLLSQCICIIFANLCLLNELLVSNFNLQYVAQYSSYETPLFFKMTALWAGQAGSLLFWSSITSFYSIFFILYTLKKIPSIKNISFLILNVILAFFLMLNNFIANPFEPVSSDIIVSNGNGLNPLLQNVTMAIHPPMLYLGFIGTTIIFVMAIAGLISNELSNKWIYSMRKWSLFTWTFLTAGIILGGYWAYNELGWGGYWAWDPVENSSLMPWLLLTAFIHTIIIQERKGILKSWNFFLASGSFILVILGTFITRSGIISSVHSFTAESLGPIFFAFLILLILISLGTYYVNKSQLIVNDKIESIKSREGGFLINNFLLVIMCFTIIWGTLFPILSEAWNDEKIHIGQSYFNALNVPLGILLLILMGMGPLLSWGNTSRESIIKKFRIPTFFSFVFGAAYLLIYLSKFDFYVFLTLIGIIFTSTAIVSEFYRIFLKHRKSAPFFDSLLSTFSRNRHRSGGYIVHIGLTLMFVGFIGKAFEVEKEFSLKPGEEIYFSNYIFKLNDISSEARGNHFAFISDFDIVSSSNIFIGKLFPEKRVYFYWNSDPEQRQPHSELDINSTLSKDIYSIFSSYDAERNVGFFKIMINPLVSWVWIGSIIMILGAILAFWPSGIRNGNI